MKSNQQPMIASKKNANNGHSSTKKKKKEKKIIKLHVCTKLIKIGFHGIFTGD